MKVVIRTDSSISIGSGHLMRCFTLADMLREIGADVSFVCRELTGNLGWLAREKGYSLFLLPFDDRESADENVVSSYAPWLGTDWATDADQTLMALPDEAEIDWLIVDHYALDEKWEKSLRWRAGHLMVIDDLANRQHDCDLLLDQNFYEKAQIRYDGFVPGHCRKLLGPQYALLRPEFLEAQRRMPERSGSVDRILVFFGGVDVTNETTKALQAIRSVGRPDVSIDVVLGRSNPHRTEIETLSQDMLNVTLHYQVENMAELMVRADLAIGGGGTTTWERCYLSLPTITIVVADNQREMIEAVAGRGAVWNMGWHASVSASDLRDRLKYALNNPEAVRTMSQAAWRVMGNRTHDIGHPIVEALSEITSVA